MEMTTDGQYCSSESICEGRSPRRIPSAAPSLRRISHASVSLTISGSALSISVGVTTVTGARLRMNRVPCRLAIMPSCSVASGRSSPWASSTSASAISSVNSSGSVTVLAPRETKTMWSPSGVMAMYAVPVGSSQVVCTEWASTPLADSSASTRSAAGSSPTVPAMTARTPACATADAWLAPLPPRARESLSTMADSPGTGNSGTWARWSWCSEPQMTTVGSSGSVSGMSRSTVASMGRMVRCVPGVGRSSCCMPPTLPRAGKGCPPRPPDLRSGGSPGVGFRRVAARRARLVAVAGWCRWHCLTTVMALPQWRAC